MSLWLACKPFSKSKQEGAPTVLSAVIRESNEFKDFRYHRGLLKYGRKKCHKVVKQIVKKTV
jgi:hypothetical protein